MLRNTLAKNTGIYLISNLVSSAIPFLLLPILTRYLDPEDYGVVSIFQVIQSIMFVMIGLNTSGAIAVNYFKRSEHNFKEYVYNVLIIIVAALLIFQVVTLVFSNMIAHILKVQSWVLNLAVASSFFGVLNKINLVLWQVEKRPIPYGMMNITNTILNILLSLSLIILFRLTWEGRIIGISIANFFTGVISIIIIAKRNYIKARYCSSYIRSALSYGLPLVPSNLSEWITRGLNRIFLVSLVSLPAAGIFAVGNQVATVISLFSAAFYKSYLPFAMEKLKSNDESSQVFLIRYTLFFFIGILFVAIFLGVISPLLIGTFIDRKYESIGSIVFLNSLGYAFLGMFTVISVFYQFMNKTSYILYISLVTVTLNILLNYLLIRENSYDGAALAIAITYLFKLILGLAFLKMIIRLPWRGAIVKTLKG